MTIRAVLVDLDGTLVDTAGANFAAYAQALAEAGVVVERERFDRVAPGRNWRQFLPELLGVSGSTADPAAIAARKAELYPDKLPLTVVNDALVALIRLVRTSLKTALVTTASAANAQAVLDHHGLASLFDVVITGSDVARHKPDPEAYVLAASRLRLTPVQCLVVEDSDIGFASARAFGALCLGIRFPVSG